MTEGPVGAGVGVRSRPRRDVNRQHQAAARRPRQRQAGHGATQSGDVYPSLVEPAVESPVTTAMFRREGEIDQRSHRAVRAQQRVAQLEQCIAPRGQTRVQLRPEA